MWFAGTQEGVELSHLGGHLSGRQLLGRGMRC
jgi:hypothetical protein